MTTPPAVRGEQMRGERRTERQVQARERPHADDRGKAGKEDRTRSGRHIHRRSHRRDPAGPPEDGIGNGQDDQEAHRVGSREHPEYEVQWVRSVLDEGASEKRARAQAEEWCGPCDEAAEPGIGRRREVQKPGADGAGRDADPGASEDAADV
jgi:hypothetical protein